MITSDRISRVLGEAVVRFWAPERASPASADLAVSPSAASAVP